MRPGTLVWSLKNRGRFGQHRFWGNWRRCGRARDTMLRGFLGIYIKTKPIPPLFGMPHLWDFFLRHALLQCLGFKYTAKLVKSTSAFARAIDIIVVVLTLFLSCCILWRISFRSTILSLCYCSHSLFSARQNVWQKHWLASRRLPHHNRGDNSKITKIIFSRILAKTW